jgi:hypothetical protein
MGQVIDIQLRRQIEGVIHKFEIAVQSSTDLDHLFQQTIIEIWSALDDPRTMADGRVPCFSRDIDAVLRRRPHGDVPFRWSAGEMSDLAVRFPGVPYAQARVSLGEISGDGVGVNAAIALCIAVLRAYLQILMTSGGETDRAAA